MLREIAHVPRPELEFVDDRESYSLSVYMLCIPIQHSK